MGVRHLAPWGQGFEGGQRWGGECLGPQGGGEDREGTGIAPEG